MNTNLYDRYVSDLKLKSYAKRSIQSYMRALRQLQNFCCKELEDITEEEVREYWLYCKEELKWGSATLRISYSGLKHFFTYTLKREWPVLKAVKFERDQTLPVVLSVDEVRKILKALPAGQNRTFYQTVYSLGLRLSGGSEPAGRRYPQRSRSGACEPRQGGQGPACSVAQQHPCGITAVLANASQPEPYLPGPGKRRQRRKKGHPAGFGHHRAGSVAAHRTQAEGAQACASAYLPPFLCDSYDRGRSAGSPCSAVSGPRDAGQYDDLSASHNSWRTPV